MTKADIVSLAKLEEDVHQALKSWHKTETAASPLSHLHLFRQVQRQGTDDVNQATNEVLHQALKALAVDFPEEARLLRLHYLDRLAMYTVANQLNISEPTANRRQRQAISRLAETLDALEDQARAKHQAVLQQRLELPTYTELIGVEDHLDTLIVLLISPRPPWLVSIEGMGGIGKTSLADALSRQIIRRQLLDDFGWVSARQHDFNPGRGITSMGLPALTAENLVEKLVVQLVADVPRLDIFSTQDALAMLQARLKQRSHLIVIDNLETLVDVETLLPTLRNLSNPTKFLLTSRESLHYAHGIYHFPLPELSQANALRLIRYEAQLHNSPYLQEATDDDLKKIFEIVGGNPLAIRLVVGQTHVYSLEVILNDLATAQGQTVENLYVFIFRRAWDILDELTRRVLLAMPLVTEGEGTLEHLAELSGIAPADLRDALNWLVSLNLVDSKGNLAERHYSIHNLTRTFLQEQVLRWS